MQSEKLPSIPEWLFWSIAIFGLVWNIFGVFQFVNSFAGSTAGLMSKGMTSEQANLYFNLPSWMTVAFAVGVFGGVAGSILLLLRSRYAFPIFAVSLLAYLVLFAGDITEGVFAAFGSSQVAILTFVVLVAAVLLVLAWHQRASGKLR